MNHWGAGIAQAVDHLLGVRQHIPAIVIWGKTANPAVEELYHLRTCGDLRLQKRRGYGCQLVQKPMPGLRLVVHQLLRLNVMARPASLNEIASQGEWGSRETDQWHLPIELAAHHPDRLEGEGQVCMGIDPAQGLDIRGGAYRILDHRTLIRCEDQSCPHRFQWNEQVSEDNSGVNRQPLHWLQRHLGRQLWRFTQVEKRIALAQSLVCSHIAPRLPHEPYGGAINGLAPASSQKPISAHAHVPSKSPIADTLNTPLHSLSTRLTPDGRRNNIAPGSLSNSIPSRQAIAS